MKFEELLKIVGDEPVFDSGLLLAGAVDPVDVHRQLSRWTAAGKIFQLRRGLYALAPPYRKVTPHPFVIANRLVRGSYVSCETALSHYGIIPEYVPVVISFTLSRPYRWHLPYGTFEFHHVKNSLFRGYRKIELAPNQAAFLATPEKALFDLIYLRPNGDAPAVLNGLRLQSLEQFDPDAFKYFAHLEKSPKLHRAARHIEAILHSEEMLFETL